VKTVGEEVSGTRIGQIEHFYIALVIGDLDHRVEDILDRC